jgi:hypothetical protein
MIGHFFMRYKRPLAYMVTKVLANHIHAAMVPRKVYASKLARASEPLTFSTHGSPKMEDWTTNRLAVTKEEKAQCVEQIAEVLPRIEKPYRPAPWKPAHAAVKRNGGLRGSTATRWR